MNIKRKQRESKEPGGIYKIENTINGKTYIGSAVNFKKRWADHKLKLSKGQHPNDHLQNAWNEYGEDKFNFEIVEVVNNVRNLTSKELCDIETNWITKTNCCDREVGYNNRSIASSNLGIKLSEETKKKMSLSHKGHTRSKGLNLGNTYAKKYELSDNDVLDILGLVVQGWTDQEIATKYGLGRTIIQKITNNEHKSYAKIVNEFGADKVKEAKRNTWLRIQREKVLKAGQASGRKRCKLTEEDVQCILEQRRAGTATLEQLAKKYGIANSTISNIELGKTKAYNSLINKDITWQQT